MCTSARVTVRVTDGPLSHTAVGANVVRPPRLHTAMQGTLWVALRATEHCMLWLRWLHALPEDCRCGKSAIPDCLDSCGIGFVT